MRLSSHTHYWYEVGMLKVYITVLEGGDIIIIIVQITRIVRVLSVLHMSSRSLRWFSWR